MKTALIHTFKLTLKPPAPMSDCGRARRGSYAGSASGKTASAYFASAEKTQAIQSPAECYVVSVLARLIHVLCALLIRLSTMRRRTPEPHPAPTRCFRSSADTSRNQGTLPPRVVSVVLRIHPEIKALGRRTVDFPILYFSLQSIRKAHQSVLCLFRAYCRRNFRGRFLRSFHVLFRKLFCGYFCRSFHGNFPGCVHVSGTVHLC